MEPWREWLVQYLRQQAQPEDKFGHQPRLYALTRELGSGLEYDDDIVFAAAWLHDLGVFVGHRPEDPALLSRWDHVTYVNHLAPGLLQTAGFPAEKIATVLEVIRTHQPKDAPQSMEGILLRDADILEQLGAIGILRTAAKLGRDTRFQRFTQVAESLEHALAELPGKLNLESSRQQARAKLAIHRQFLKSLREEGQPELF